MVSRLRRRMRLPGKLAWMCRRLEKITTAKGEYLAAKVTNKGRSAAEILAESLPKELSSIYWPKNMYWRKHERTLCAAGALAGGDAGRAYDSAGVRRDPGGKHFARTPDSGRRGRNNSAGPGLHTSMRCERRRFWGAMSASSRFARLWTLPTRTIPGARWREDKSLLDTRSEPDRISFRDSGRVRSAVSCTAGRGIGHGDARSSKIFCTGRCEQGSCCRIFWRC